jgi:tetratricopeptide (TPR) repeat protein
MSYVYVCAEPPPSNRRFAVKRLRREFNRTPEASRRFLRECLIWLKLGRHTNIVTAHSAHQAWPEPPALVLEYHPRSVREALTGEPWAVGRTVLLGIGILRALRHAATVFPDFVHADLKPENVLLSSDGVVKVTDFGLSRMVAETAGRDGAAGTPAYMAPEQVNGDQLTIATDVYALGCLLYEAAIGQPVFGWRDDRAYRRAHTVTAAPRPATGVPELDRLISACLAKDPHLRPSTRAALDELERTAVRLRVPVPDAVAEYPGWPELRNVAQSLVSIRLFEESIALCREILATPDEDPQRRLWTGPVLARALRESGRLAEAQAELDQTDRVFQHPAAGNVPGGCRVDWLNEQAAVASLRGDHDAALPLGEQVVAIAPEGSVGWANLGKVRHQLGDIEGAVAAMTRAWEISADLRYAFHLISWLIVVGRSADAAPIAREAASWHPDSGLAHALCVMALEESAVRGDARARTDLMLHIGQLDRLRLSFDELDGSGVSLQQWQRWRSTVRRLARTWRT